MFIPVSVCLSVCLPARLLKKLSTDFDESFGGVGHSQRTVGYILVAVKPQGRDQ